MRSHTSEHPAIEGARSKTALTIGTCVLLAIVAFFLWTEHRAHLMGVLPYLLLLLCPIIHLFMHRRHRGGHGGNESQPGGRP
jgi:hypothetical protein